MSVSCVRERELMFSPAASCLSSRPESDDALSFEFEFFKKTKSRLHTKIAIPHFGIVSPFFMQISSFINRLAEFSLSKMARNNSKS